MRDQPTTALSATNQRAAASDQPGTSGPAQHVRQPSADGSAVDPQSLPSLLRLRITWKVLAWWTLFYGVASWFLEYGFSRLDPAAKIPFWFGLNRVVYAFMWAWALLVAIISTEWFPITSKRQIGRIALHAVLAITMSVLWGVVGYYV